MNGSLPIATGVCLLVILLVPVIAFRCGFLKLGVYAFSENFVQQASTPSDMSASNPIHTSLHTTPSDAGHFQMQKDASGFQKDISTEQVESQREQIEHLLQKMQSLQQDDASIPTHQ